MKPVRHSMVEDAAQMLVNRASIYFFLKLTQNHSIKFLGPGEWSEGKITWLQPTICCVWFKDLGAKTWENEERLAEKHNLELTEVSMNQPKKLRKPNAVSLLRI